jgi:hypothetical protein
MMKRYEIEFFDTFDGWSDGMGIRNGWTYDDLKKAKKKADKLTDKLDANNKNMGEQYAVFDTNNFKPIYISAGSPKKPVVDTDLGEPDHIVFKCPQCLGLHQVNLILHEVSKEIVKPVIKEWDHKSYIENKCGKFEITLKGILTIEFKEK